jgi:hypothetical protein
VKRPGFLISLLVASTFGLAVVTTGASWSLPAPHAFWFCLAACLIGELLWVRLPAGQATVSMASCAQFAALLLLPRGPAMFVAGMSTALAELLFMRKPPIRTAFNGAQAALAVGAASWIVSLGHDPRAGDALVQQLPSQLLARWPLVVAAAAAYVLVNTLAVSAAIALSERMSLVHAWRTNFGDRRTMLSNLALFSLGTIMAWLYATGGAVTALLVPLPLAAVYGSYPRLARAPAAGAGPSSREAA